MTDQVVLGTDVGDEHRARLLDGTSIIDRRIDARGTATAVLEHGAGDDVVLLHGPGEFAAIWRDTIAGLGATHHVVAPDLPGHGETAAGPERSPQDVLDWLADVIGETCASPPVLVGRVLGGSIAARFCIDRADSVCRLVLVDTLGLAPFEPAPPFGEALGRYLAEPTDRTFEQLMEYCAHDFAAVRRRLGAGWTSIAGYAVARMRTPATQAAVGALMAHFGFGEIPEHELARIRVPTSLIWGRHDLATPLRVAEAASRAFGWTLHVVEDAADDPAVDQPEAFLDVLHDIIDLEVQP